MPIAENRYGIALLEYTQMSETCLGSDDYRPLIGSYVAIKHNDGILLVYHRRRQGWELPSGGIEEGESARACALRELFEETGQSVEHLEFRAVLKHGDRSGGIQFFALFSGQLASPTPFRKNEETSRITFWDGTTDIGHIDEIDRAVIDLLKDSQP
jgi:8-oxo-dGTP diphosphatase